jgi:predicted Zn-dependent protease
MKKIIFQIIVLVALFFGTWYALSYANWMSILRVEKISNATEKKLGDLVWNFYSKSETEIDNKEIVEPIDSLLTKICISNNIDRKKIKLHILESDEINAFALPDRHLVINTALILSVKNESELSGVIAHEVAHMEMKHVMKKLVKEMGISAILSISTGNAGSEIIKKVVKLISSSAYDRKLEKEADTKAVDYLIKSKINPLPFADFMQRLADKEADTPEYFNWISTHPDSKERAQYIKDYSGQRLKKPEPVLSNDSWEKLQVDLQNLKDLKS